MNESCEIINQDESQAPHKGICRLADCYVGGEYDVTLKLFSDKQTKTPECAHHMKGVCKHNLLKLMALGGIAAVAIGGLVCLVHMCCSAMCKHC